MTGTGSTQISCGTDGGGAVPPRVRLPFNGRLT
jgi:hypothetical protein